MTRRIADAPRRRRRQWRLAGALAVAGLLALSTVPWQIVRRPFVHRWLEGSLSRLLGATVRLEPPGYDPPFGLSAGPARLEEGGDEVGRIESVRVDPGFLSLLSGAPRIGSLELGRLELTRRGMGALAVLAAQPADRLPHVVRVRSSSGRVRIGRAEETLQGLDLELTSDASRERSFEARFSLGVTAWNLTGRLTPRSDGSLGLESSGESRGPWRLSEVPLLGSLTGDGLASLEATARLAGGRLDEAHARIRADTLSFASSRFPGPITFEDVDLSVDDRGVRLGHARLRLGGNAVRVSGAYDRSRLPELHLECDRLEAGRLLGGSASPLPEGNGPVVATTMTVRGGWPAPHVAFRLRLVEGEISAAGAAPGGTPIRRLGVRFDGTADLIDLKLTNLKLEATADDNRRLVAHGSVTVPPWDRTNPILGVSVDMAGFPAGLLHGRFASEPAAFLATSARITFKGQVDGPLRQPRPRGRLRIQSGGAGSNYEWMAALVEPVEERSGQQLTLSDATWRTPEGRIWKAVAPLRILMGPGGARFATGAELRSTGGLVRIYAPGDAVAP